MTDSELIEIITKLREYTFAERQKHSTKKLDVFFINVIEISCCLTELGLKENREITPEERYWFEGAYHMNFWDGDVEQNLYGPLIREVARRNWFK